MSPSPAEDPHDRSERLAVLAAQTTLALVTSLLFIGRKNLWLDESYSFIAAHRSLGDLWHLVTTDESNMSPYYLALHFWLALGRTEAVIRLLSVPAAVATVPVVATLGARLYGRRAGVVAGFLAAGNLMLVSYAQEARAYSLVLLLTAVSGLLFVRLVERPGGVVAVAWGLTSGVAVYAHYYALLVVVAQVATLAVLPKTSRPRLVLAGLAVTAVVDAPLVWFVAHRGTGPLSSAAGASLVEPARLVYRFAGSIPLGLVCASLAGFAGWTSIREARTRWRSVAAWRELYAWVWLVLPVALVLAGAVVRPMWKDRYLIVCLPAFLVVVSAGLARLSKVQVRWTVAALLAAGAAVALIGYYGERVKQGADWRAATAYVSANAAAGDAWWYLPSTAYVPFDYYAWKRSQPPPPDVSLPADGLRGRLHPRTLPAGVVQQRIAGSRRVWLVLFGSGSPRHRLVARHESAEIARMLHGFRLVQQRRFGPLLVVRLYVR